MPVFKLYGCIHDPVLKKIPSARANILLPSSMLSHQQGNKCLVNLVAITPKHVWAWGRATGTLHA